LKYSFSYIEDIGLVRSHQEDNGFILLSHKRKIYYPASISVSGQDDDLIIMCVADGMGGAKNGALASTTAIDAIKEYFSQKIFEEIIADIPLNNVQVLSVANEKIHEIIESQPLSKGMGTTVVLGIIYQKHLYLAWIGDSRCYLFHNGHLTLVTKDHSYVQDLIDKNIINEEDEFDHPRKNVITQSLGSIQINPSTKIISLEANTKVLFCSDGLNTMLKFSEIENEFNKYEDINKVNQSLLRICKEKGAYDNITLCLSHLHDDNKSLAKYNNQLSTNTYSGKTKINPIDGKSSYNLTILFLLAIILFSIYQFNKPILAYWKIVKFESISQNFKENVNKKSVDLSENDLIPNSEYNNSHSITDSFELNCDGIKPNNYGNYVFMDTTCIKTKFESQNYSVRYDVYATESAAISEMTKLQDRIKDFSIQIIKLKDNDLFGIFIDSFKLKNDAEAFIIQENMKNAIIVKITE